MKLSENLNESFDFRSMIYNTLADIFQSYDITKEEFQDAIDFFNQKFWDTVEEEEVEEGLVPGFMDPIKTIANVGKFIGSQVGLTEKKNKSWEDSREDFDLWTNVYNNLATDLDPNDVVNIVPTKKGERYNELRTDFDGNIIVYGNKVEDFDLAKRVADHYNLKVTEPVEDKNQYYKYTMKIIIPEEE